MAGSRRPEVDIVVRWVSPPLKPGETPEQQLEEARELLLQFVMELARAAARRDAELERQALSCKYVSYGIHLGMIEVQKTATFADWLSGLRDRQARARIQVRIDRLALGNPGDVKPVGEGVSELRVVYSPGYRIYFVQRGNVLVVLLCGGDKSSQSRDIAAAKALARELGE